MVPNPVGTYGNNERVDLLTYETKGIWRFYELKVSKSDFNSKCKLSWYGDFNYYILPYDLYPQVYDKIPKGIGVYIASDSGNFWCEVKPKKQKLQLDHNKLMFSFMQSMSREYAKYRKILKYQDEENKTQKQIILPDTYDYCHNCKHSDKKENEIPCIKCTHGTIDYFEKGTIEF